MDHDQLQFDLRQSASVRLLKSPNAALILSFLHHMFKVEQRVSLPYATILERLDATLETLNEHNPSSYPLAATAYLKQWSDEEHQLLRIIVRGSDDETTVELTADAERAIGWVEELYRREFVGTDNVALVLGDNIFYGHGLPDDLRRAAQRKDGATVFAYQVRDPERYGVVEFAPNGQAISLEEKPKAPRSHWAVTGLYFYDNRVLDVARDLKPSPRGELEITDVNKQYLEWSALHVEKLGRGIAWLDTGTHESLQQASSFIQTLQERQGLMAACLEEIAFHNGWMTPEDVLRIAEPMRKNEYGQYLLRMLQQVEQGAQPQ